MQAPRIASRDEWLDQRTALLASHLDHYTTRAEANERALLA